MFQRTSEPNHFVQALRLNSLRLRKAPCARRAEAALQVRSKVVPNLVLSGIRQTSGNSPPHDPEFGPDSLVGVCVYACREKGGSLLRTPLIQRIAESGTQCISGQLKPDPLVV